MLIVGDRTPRLRSQNIGNQDMPLIFKDSRPAGAQTYQDASRFKNVQFCFFEVSTMAKQKYTRMPILIN